MKSSNAILVATPSEKNRAFIEEGLRTQELDLVFVGGGAEALNRLEGQRCWVLLLDRELPDLDAYELKRLIELRYPQIGIWIVSFDSGWIRFETGAESVPVPAEFLPLLECPAERDVRVERGPDRCLDTPACYPRVRWTLEQECLPGIIGKSDSIQRLESLVRLVVSRSTTVLLTGETGTGKELVSKAIHILGPRARRPFVVVNCAAIPEALFESELFGFSRGAFTGAMESRLGRIQAANSGTLFLDEIGELPLSMQPKLLRFLQEGEVQRLGGHDPSRVDVRVIAATNADLGQLVGKKLFREDLFYRLSVFPIEIEPLRERQEDIGPLAQHFIEDFCAESECPAKYLTPISLSCLMAHRWPGNVRELKHAVERACILADRSPVLLAEHFSLMGRKTPSRFPIDISQKNLIVNR